jgi:DNA-binding CsgD family transcriptional regulator
MQRYVELTPAIALVRANPGVPVISTRQGIPGSEREILESAFYREVMQPQGWRHAAVLCFWTDPPVFPILVLSVFRTLNQRDFSTRDLSRLERLHPFLAPAVTGLFQASASNAVSKGVGRAMRSGRRGVIVLDGQLRVVCANPKGRQALAEWRGSMRAPRRPADSTAIVPHSLAAICRRLGRAAQSATRKTRTSAPERCDHVKGPGGSRLVASIIAMCADDAMAEPSFVIEFERRSRARDVRAVQALEMLTPSERDVVVAVAEGLSNKEVVEHLGKSLEAVKFLLHRAYRKLGTANRTQTALLLRRHGTHSR